jgi:hypothetical protein
MVNLDKDMKIPLDYEDSPEGIYLVNNHVQECRYVALVLAEEEPYRDYDNLLKTRKDAIYILNAVNNFELLLELVNNYREVLKGLNSNNSDIDKINDLIKSFKTIDYDNDIPYNWDDTFF